MVNMSGNNIKVIGNMKNANGKTSKVSTAKPEETAAEKESSGWSEIEGLLNSGKKKKKEQKEEIEELERSRKKKKKNYSSSTPSMSGKSDSKWIDDGLGGVYNSEGFTGRVEDGVKVFKAHILQKEDAGQSPDCPFDCDCCYI